VSANYEDLHEVIFSTLLEDTSRHEDIRRSGGKAPHNLEFGTRWRWVVCFASRSHLQQKSPLPYETHWIGACVGSTVGFDVVARIKSRSLPVIEPRSYSL